MIHRKHKLSLAIAAALVAAGTSGARAASLFWDADGTGAANGGAGNWLDTGKWATDAAGTSHVDWTNGSDAKFVQGAATVTIVGGVTANSVEFQNTTVGYHIAGGTLT